ncbi:MAG: hypothetical protein LUH02_07140, partial [Erysipelotrichaceae bacterium]|nr:hypothetical protein [Erysipelotrichaceae bacterium]
IYSLKNTITIQEIKKVLTPYHDETNKIEPLYNQYLDIKKELSHLVTDSLTQIIDEHQLNLDDQDQLTLMLLYICTLSNQYKLIAEKMLDTFYIDE